MGRRALFYTRAPDAPTSFLLRRLVATVPHKRITLGVTPLIAPKLIRNLSSISPLPSISTLPSISPLSSISPFNNIKNSVLAWNRYTSLDVSQLEILSPEDFVNVMYAVRNSNSPDTIAKLEKIAKDFRSVHGSLAIRGYNMLLHAHFSQSNLDAANALFLKIQDDHDLSPDSVTIVTMIGGISNLGQISDLHGFCRQMEESGNTLFLSLDVYKRLIIAFGQHGDPTTASLYFRQMSSKGIQPDTGAYNLLIAILVDNKDLERARALFEEMGANGIPHSVGTYHILIQAYQNARREDEMRGLYNRLKTAGIPPNSSIYAAMGWDPLNALEEMRMLDIMPSTTRDFNMLISMAIKRNNFSAAFQIFQQMQEAGVQPDVVSHSLVIDALVKDQQPERAFELFDAMKKSGVEADVVTYTSLIQACVHTSDLNGALLLLETMRDHRITPNLHTFNALLSVVSSRKGLLDGDRDFTMAIFHKMKDMRIFPDVRTYNLVLAVLSKQITHLTFPSLSPADSTLIPHRNLASSTFPSPSSADSILISQRNLAKMRSLYSEMRRLKGKSSRPDFVTYSIMINSFLDAGDTRSAMGFYHDMRTHRGITLPVQIFNALMAACEQQGNPTQVIGLWKDMRMARVNPDQDSYDIVLEACRKYGHMDTWQMIQEQQHKDEMLLGAPRTR
ncbi:hypothetical protein BC938DRAFT_471226 [Jimgerdemannia flammicorona]|uniref:Pentacotripeptide-repeat region of PRORP domain-containing protein n=1 Tax=Jimgerdemannia flammicorona TaxID=994334 RepID=A0A433QUY2_9FUNG|nr:hypothetical protein BC938DRAFT_471226 [Jimgerdemannia flammicorona]